VSFKVIEVGINRKPKCDFLLVFPYRPNYMPILYRFRDITIYLSKMCNLWPFLLTAGSFDVLARWFPWDLGYGIENQESLGYQWWKLCDRTVICFESRTDGETDRQTDKRHMWRSGIAERDKNEKIAELVGTQLHAYGKHSPCRDRDNILHVGRHPWHS